MAQTEHKRSAGEGVVPAVVESRLAGGKESLVGGMATLAVVESKVRLVVESTASPVAAEDLDKAVMDMIAGHS